MGTPWVSCKSPVVQASLYLIIWENKKNSPFAVAGPAYAVHSIE